MARMVLVGIVLAFLSGVMLFLPKAEMLLQTPKFLVKCIIFGVVVINGFFLHHVLFSKLIHFSFHKEHYLTERIHLRHVGFIAGAISLVSWYSVFLLGSFKDIPFSFWELMTAYGSVLVVAVVVSLFVEKKIKKISLEAKSKD